MVNIIFGLNIFYFIYMKRDWANIIFTKFQRNQLASLGTAAQTMYSEENKNRQIDWFKHILFHHILNMD